MDKEIHCRDVGLECDSAVYSLGFLAAHFWKSV